MIAQFFAYQQIDETAWAFIGSLLMISLFFKFNRFWSVRNLDLVLIILLAPCFILIHNGAQWAERYQSLTTPSPSVRASPNAIEPAPATPDAFLQPASSPPRVAAESPVGKLPLDSPEAKLQRRGYIGLFIVGAIFLLRMLFDPLLVRRPLLNPNLTQGGLIFLGLCLIVLLFANIFAAKPTTSELDLVKSTIRMVKREAADEADSQYLRQRGPGYQTLFFVAVISVFSDSDANEIVVEEEENLARYILVLKILATISQSLIVVGLVLFASRNFNSFYSGVGIASVYLMLPYTAIYTGHVEHTLPAVLILWALVCFRKPELAGVFIGLATGASYYPLFLLPLWISFYWDRGVRRFTGCFAIAIAVCILSLGFTSSDPTDFLQQLQKMFGFWQPQMDGLEGIWALGWDRIWRLPLLVAFVILSVSFVAWPISKDIGVLVAYTAAIMIAVQFWHGFGGGLFAAWYLPLMLLTFFRTNVSNRTAVQELPDLRAG